MNIVHSVVAALAWGSISHAPASPSPAPLMAPEAPVPGDGNRQILGNSTKLTCQSRSGRYPWSKLPLQRWTPKARTGEPELSAPGAAIGAPFMARIVQAYGQDYQDADTSVIFEMADGCRRQFRVDSFIDSDRARIAAEVARHPFIPDPATYALGYREGQTTADMLNKGEVGVYQTQHFAIWYGKNRAGSFYRTMAERGVDPQQAIRQTGAWLEYVWLVNRDVLNAPLPYVTSRDRKKLDVYLCGSGRKTATGDDLEDCGAMASEVMYLSAWTLLSAANTTVHEFGHMIQFYSGGLNGRTDAGPIWETGAEWNSLEVSPSFYARTGSHFDFLEFGPLYSPARYGANPILAYLFEKDDTRALVFGAWQRDRRDAAGMGLEDYVPAFVRIGQEDGVYPKGYASFANDMGWYGARLVTMDFVKQAVLNDILFSLRSKNLVPHFYTPLVTAGTAGDPTLFAPPASRDLLEFGTHIVPLTATGRTVKVTLTGATTANQASWRFTLVAVDKAGVPHYAPLAAVTGTGSATVTMTPPTGARLFLTVTATPYVYESLGWQADGKPPVGTRFPYRVRIIDAVPAPGSVEACQSASLVGSRPCVSDAENLKGT